MHEAVWGLAWRPLVETESLPEALQETGIEGVDPKTAGDKGDPEEASSRTIGLKRKQCGIHRHR